MVGLDRHVYDEREPTVRAGTVAIDAREYGEFGRARLGEKEPAVGYCRMGHQDGQVDERQAKRADSRTLDDLPLGGRLLSRFARWQVVRHTPESRANTT